MRKLDTPSRRYYGTRFPENNEGGAARAATGTGAGAGGGGQTVAVASLMSPLLILSPSLHLS